jgi:hypothetical protein
LVVKKILFPNMLHGADQRRWIAAYGHELVKSNTIDFTKKICEFSFNVSNEKQLKYGIPW